MVQERLRFKKIFLEKIQSHRKVLDSSNPRGFVDLYLLEQKMRETEGESDAYFSGKRFRLVCSGSTTLHNDDISLTNIYSTHVPALKIDLNVKCINV